MTAGGAITIRRGAQTTGGATTTGAEYTGTGAGTPICTETGGIPMRNEKNP
jgi:hypothetical protein